MREFLSRLRENNIQLKLVGDDLSVRHFKGKIDKAIFDEISSKKEDLIIYLKGINQYKYAGIPRAGEQPHYPLSSSQHRLWVLSQLEEGNIAYNIPGANTFEGKLDLSVLTHSFKKLLGRHEILRTVFKEDEQGRIRQFIHPQEKTGFEIACHDLRQEEGQEEKTGRLIKEEFGRPFDLASGPLLRASLYRVKDDKWIFAYVTHHIVSDGWSMGILIKELLQIYNTHIEGEDDRLSPLHIHYKDYATWQQAQLGEDFSKVHKEYWLKQFEGELPVLDLPLNKARPLVKMYNGGVIVKTFDRGLVKGLKAIIIEQNCTLFIGLVTAVNALLYRYTSQEDIIIGSPIAGREDADLEGQIGCYINTLALRTRFRGKDSFREMLEKVRQVTLGAYEHQVYPFDELVDALNLRRDMSRNPLFDVAVTLQNAGMSSTAMKQGPGDLRISDYQGEEYLVSKFDLAFSFVEEGEGLYVSIVYNSDIYAEDGVGRLAEHLTQIMVAVVKNPSMPISRLGFLSEREKDRLLNDFNDTAADYPRDKTIIELFEHQVERTPHSPAVIHAGATLTYKELNEKSNRFGAYLKGKYKIQPDELVAINLERSDWMVIAILGILKAGGAYLPLDKEYPGERIGYMVDNSGSKALIDEEELKRFRSEERLYDNQNPEPAGKAGDLAYVIYTSGSTGLPKGVMVEHQALVNLCFWHKTGFQVTKEDHAGLYAGTAFDASVWELFPYLISGSCLFVIPAEIRLNAHALTEFFEANNISISFLPTQVAAHFMEVENKSLRYLLIGGDKMNFVVKKEYQLINNYGPTENTVVATSHKVVRQDQVIPIGKPISNVRIYILDKYDQLAGIGICGEICIGGAGLARGYLNQPELTAEKFVKDPFRAGERMYRTGDIGRWLADGNIEFLDRRDDQVKIRGHRIELGEIETALQGHPDIDSAVVAVKVNREGEKELIAYVLSEGKLNRKEIRHSLAMQLPGYMLPAHFVRLDSIPLTSNGKVDRKGLPEPGGQDLSAGIEYIAPRNKTEEDLAAIWQEILGVENAGAGDDFFDLGGHSLKAARLANRIRRELDVKITLKDLFANTILEEQAKLIMQARKTAFIELFPAPIQTHYPLSSSQRLFWISCQFEEANIAYNIPSVYIWKGDLDIASLERSFYSLIERHESLRTVFREDEQGEVRQFILSPENAGFRMRFEDVRNEREEELEILVRSGSVEPFDLAAGPLVRAGLFRITDDKWALACVIHHIISDGRSMSVLIRELLTLYNTYGRGGSNPLTPLPVQYKDYAVWQQEQLRSDASNEHKAYWTKQFEGDLPVLALPSDKKRPAIKTYKGGMIHWTIDDTVARDLKALFRQQECTLFMGLLAAVNTLLYKYSDQTDMIIGTSVAGRDYPGLEDQVGYYLNTLALRTQFSAENNYVELLEIVKKLTMDAYEHQAYPFEELVETLQVSRDISRNNLFDVLVVVRNTDFGDEDIRISGLGNIEISAYKEIDRSVSKFDLTFSFVETPEKLQAGIEYNSDLFNSSSIVKMSSDLEQLLSEIVQKPFRPVCQLMPEGFGKSRILLTALNERVTQFISTVSTDF